ncbi:hypothetical protein HZF08_30515 [Paenibacillus sp. CGMCC 1.16610]|uniref:Uncharacterized protein n=2 Tax=Paenibacillus TaxID=44249 RepID=A0ABU6D7Y4_9BACL|nr:MULTISPECIES: hypothetical protein [Paenibacillus]MBA2942611.1 hypothetical protein [Paenibacillus sp. CGMCC 1.16610]MCY9661772.1 hypothetical protein [Paenibacillus anseongense]MEB4793857.1 hypothetical protein [Paenibacillus chondroitinus]MVQ35425.1 hypothetical protein [Paenibacillus anseongense]
MINGIMPFSFEIDEHVIFITYISFAKSYNKSIKEKGDGSDDEVAQRE